MMTGYERDGAPSTCNSQPQNMRIFIKKLFLLLLFLNLGCKDSSETKDKKDPDVLVVQMQQSSEDHKTVFWDRGENYPVLSAKGVSGEDYQQLVSSFRGIPEMDTFSLNSEKLHSVSFLIEILTYVTSEEKKAFLDTVGLFSIQNGDRLNLVSGFKDDKHLIILDANQNRDFSDDSILEFPRDDFRVMDEETLAQLPVIELPYKVILNGTTHNLRRKIQVYPDPRNTYGRRLGDTLLAQLNVSMRLKDHWRGEISVEGVDYVLGVQGLNERMDTFILRPDSLDLRQLDEQSFQYWIGDTLQLQNSFFRLEQLHPLFSEVRLRKIEVNTPYYSYRMGSRVRDLELTAVDNSRFKISEAGETPKEFILLDFWGTWCVPCIDLLPEIREFHSEAKDKVNFIGVAMDDSIRQVRRFTEEHQMDWPQAFVPQPGLKGITKELKIRSYPTFILLDRNLTILYRGVGAEGLEGVKRLIGE